MIRIILVCGLLWILMFGLKVKDTHYSISCTGKDGLVLIESAK